MASVCARSSCNRPGRFADASVCAFVGLAAFLLVCTAEIFIRDARAEWAVQVCLVNKSTSAAIGITTAALVGVLSTDSLAFAYVVLLIVLTEWRYESSLSGGVKNTETFITSSSAIIRETAIRAPYCRTVNITRALVSIKTNGRGEGSKEGKREESFHWMSDNLNLICWLCPSFFGHNL